MPIFRVQTRLAHDTPSYTPYKWSYLWFVDAENIDAAVSVGQAVWEALRPAHSNRVFCYELYVSDTVASTTLYTTFPMPAGNQRGTAATVTNLLPTFNVVRVDLNVSASRPSRKFHRLPLGEEQIVNGNLETGTSGIITTAFNAAVDVPGVVDESGNGFIGVTVKGVTSRRLGKFAYTAVPAGPPLG